VPVLGMHRSGTSVATRLLGLAGARLPTVAGPGRTRNPANESGFWEVRPLTDTNESLLRALDGEWSAPPPLPDGWPGDPRLDTLTGPAVAQARRYLRPGVLWKDPRLCLTLPFWTSVIPRQSPAVLVVRNPIEVADSLAARNGFDEALASALWERYLRDALKAVTGRAVMVLSYDDAVTRPHEVVRTARAWFESLDLPMGVFASDDAVARFVTVGLRHNVHDDADVAGHPVLDDAQKALHVVVSEVVGAHDAFHAQVPPASSDATELLERRRVARRDYRVARAPWTSRARQAVLGRASLASRRVRARRG
jgi:hypothetical protein